MSAAQNVKQYWEDFNNPYVKQPVAPRVRFPLRRRFIARPPKVPLAMRQKVVEVVKEIKEAEKVKEKKVVPKKVDSTDKYYLEFLRLCRLVLNDNICVLFLIFSASTVFSHYSGLKGGFLESVISSNSNNSFAAWVKSNHNKFLGLVVFFPVCYKLPSENRLVLGGMIVAWIFLFNALPVLEYVACAFFLFAYFKTTLQPFKFLVVALAAASISLGYLTFGGKAKS